MNSPPKDEDTLFSAALELPAAARRAWLEKECEDHPAVLSGVLALLQAHDASGDFMRDPVSPGSWGGEVPAQAGSAGAMEKSGDRVGAYKLLQRMGEGGWGIVWMAEQSEAIIRRVALKILKPGLDTAEVVARFDAERQALALMDHPNIARVLDGGATQGGRPYFVMELVKGEPMTRFCDDHQLSINERLRVFMHVCHAVQHAHQKGIIHRDLKPSNVLVTLQDGGPVPKVIDFGIAKALSGRLTDRTLFTEQRTFIGTPPYTSPEQVDLRGLDIDTRSDIYSLGVILYELLSGQAPFAKQALQSAGIEQVRRTICEIEPPRPSARVAGLPEAERETVAKCRREDPARLPVLLERDLDWIVMRCLEKSRTRRYETANALAMDIERYLEQQPVVARPPSAWYRFGKWVRRNQVTAAAVGALALVLFVGSATSTWLALRARRAEQEQRRMFSQAEREAGHRAQVAAFMKVVFKDIALLMVLEEDTAQLTGILDQAVARVERELPEQPAVEADLLETLGGLLFNIGEVGRAENAFVRALEHRRQAGAGPERATTLNYLSLVQVAGGKYQDAEARLREALAINLGLADPPVAEVARTRSNLGWVLKERGRLEEARLELDVALSLFRQYNKGPSVDEAYALKRLGQVLTLQGELDEAEACLRESVRLNTALLGRENLEVASSLNVLAVTLAIQNEIPAKVREGIGYYRAAQQIRADVKRSRQGWNPGPLMFMLTRQGTPAEVEELVREAHQYASYRYPDDRWKSAYYCAMEAFVFQQERKFLEAEQAARKCYELRLEQRPEDWSTYHAQSMIGGALFGRGMLAQGEARDGILAEAEDYLLKGYSGMKKVEASIPEPHRLWLGETLRVLASLFEQRHGAEAARRWRQEYESFVRVEQERAHAGGG